MQKLLALKQYEKSESQHLSVEERDTLLQVVPELVISPIPGQTDEYILTPGSHIGAVQIGALVVMIEPKIPVSRVLFLISYGLDRFHWGLPEPQMTQAPDVFEAVALAFATQAQRATGRGLLHGYQTVEEALPVVRGRLRLGDQMTRHFGRMFPIEVAYDDFTHDIHENMLLRAALSRLKGLRIRSGETLKRLRHLDGALREVAHARYAPRNLPTLTYTRLNRHYQSADELAKLILRCTSFEAEHGHVHVRSFLLNMDDVFEDFVYTSLREALGLSSKDFVRKAKGKSLYLDQGHRVPLEPDLSWWDGSLCRFVGDVKYKTVAGRKPHNADLYQLLAYATAADVREAMLVYAASGEQPGVGSFRVKHAGVDLRIESLDLASEPLQIIAQIATIADSARDIARRVDFVAA